MDALAESPDVFETFFDHARIGLALADLSTSYVRVNETYADLLGRSPEDLIGVPFAQVLHPDDRPAEDMRGTLLLAGDQGSLTAEERLVSPDGGVRWVLHSVNLVRDDRGTPAWFAVSAQDITERRRAEESLRELTAALTERAVRDPLTGLANRALLHERLRAVLARDARTGDTTGVLFLDLDGFKAINDDYGHAVGDSVLKVVANRLQAAVRPSDTVARLGGDEFVVLVEGTSDDGLTALVERLASAVSTPVRLRGGDVTVGASIGVAVSRAGEDDASHLLETADAHMYRAKRASRVARARQVS